MGIKRTSLGFRDIQANFRNPKQRFPLGGPRKVILEWNLNIKEMCKLVKDKHTPGRKIWNGVVGRLYKKEKNCWGWGFREILMSLQVFH